MYRANNTRTRGFGQTIEVARLFVGSRSSGFLPRFTPGSTNLGLRIPSTIEVPAYTTRRVALNISIKLPRGFAGLILPNGILSVQGWVITPTLVNGYGTYNSVFIDVFNCSANRLTMNHGCQIGFLVLIPWTLPRVIVWNSVNARNTYQLGNRQSVVAVPSEDESLQEDADEMPWSKPRHRSDGFSAAERRQYGISRGRGCRHGN